MLDGKPRILSKPEGVLASDCQANHKIYRGRSSKARQDKTRQINCQARMIAPNSTIFLPHFIHVSLLICAPKSMFSIPRSKETLQTPGHGQGSHGAAKVFQEAEAQKSWLSRASLNDQWIERLESTNFEFQKKAPAIRQRPEFALVTKLDLYLIK